MLSEVGKEGDMGDYKAGAQGEEELLVFMELESGTAARGGLLMFAHKKQ